MSHRNAFLAHSGRLQLARCIVVDGWPLRRAAERFNVSVPTAARWSRRYRELGEDGLEDRRSRPLTCPHRTRMRTERRVLGLRVNRRWGPARIAYHLHLNISTVHRILTRYLCPPLRFTDPATGIRVRGRDRTRRYEYAWPGEMIHVDIKKLGRIPDGGGHRIHGRVQGKANSRAQNLGEGRAKYRGQVRGYTFLHHAVDDHSRFVYSEILPDETQTTASAFMRNAIAAFAAQGVKIEKVLTDNGSCYRSRAFAAVLAEAGIRHKRTKPYRPQTNGKVERFNRILQEEWAYARAYGSEAERQACYQDFVEYYNRRRPHTALKGASPASRVTNQPG
ncbi:IS481 family transposase [Pseudarthrobacter sp. fls2-241-R2A-127]|uniref:IS481 family transposase n=1 Tax=Pseudarthrobacter sp. fls2-241-R2A-127 TaxID=3040303 RepID=UPI0025542BC1|nr:IS481 family transposase [Pseudarthrobacter sp. fls2-241-R2A-127]